jgi:hypothetical protein
MEFVHGQDAASVLRNMKEQHQAVPIAETLSIIAGICHGLHYAHECLDQDGKPLGIIHRDISPSNVLVSYDGAVMITDFGIAKAACRTSDTTTGAVRGKLAYMSPEQCQGLVLDRRSDVFALGIVLYELSTGNTLFHAPSDFDIMKAIVEGPICPPSAILPDYPRELERIVLKALSRDPRQRYATARDMQVDIEAFALDQKLQISSVRLAHFMAAQFGDKIAAWRQAQRDGELREPRENPLEAIVEIVPPAAPATRDERARARARQRRNNYALGGLLAILSLMSLSPSALVKPPAVVTSDTTSAPLGASLARASAALIALPNASARVAAAALLTSPAAAAELSQRAATEPSPRETPPASVATALPAPTAARFASSPAIAFRRVAPPSSALLRHHKRPQHHRGSQTRIAKQAHSAPERAHLGAWNPEDGLPPAGDP